MARTIQHTQDSFRLPARRSKSHIEKTVRTRDSINKQLDPTSQIESWISNGDLQYVERLSNDLDVMLCIPLGIRVIRKVSK
jgi:hypothetical protein